ncbi:MAG: hypothetical protein OEU92_06050 [Alphaproteobacteria bacterium]|nr:hypothetical protein [Alphaproteobacteria bacterium]
MAIHQRMHGWRDVSVRRLEAEVLNSLGQPTQGYEGGDEASGTREPMSTQSSPLSLQWTGWLPAGGRSWHDMRVKIKRIKKLTRKDTPIILESPDDFDDVHDKHFATPGGYYIYRIWFDDDSSQELRNPLYIGIVTRQSMLKRFYRNHFSGTVGNILDFTLDEGEQSKVAPWLREIFSEFGSGKRSEFASSIRIQYGFIRNSQGQMRKDPWALLSREAGLITLERPILQDDAPIRVA